MHPWARCLFALAQANQAVHPSGVVELVPASAEVNVLCATAGTAYVSIIAAVSGCFGAKPS
jgi:hypothetical protein